MSQPVPKPGQQIVAAAVVDSLEHTLRGANQIDIWEFLSARLEKRVRMGKEKYGTLLMSHNGRNALEDAWEETCDLVMYLHQAKMEGEHVYFQVLQAENMLCSITKMLMMKGATQ